MTAALFNSILRRISQNNGTGEKGVLCVVNWTCSRPSTESHFMIVFATKYIPICTVL